MTAAKRYTGMNSILVYCGSEVLQGYWPFSWPFSVYSHWGHLFANLTGAAAWNLIATVLFHKRWFLKI